MKNLIPLQIKVVRVFIIPKFIFHICGNVTARNRNQYTNVVCKKNKIMNLPHIPIPMLIV
jgi:hypothetical protein